MMDPSRLMLTLLCGSGRGKVSPRVMVLLSEPSWFQQKAGHGMQTSSTKAVAHQMPQICSWATHGQNKRKKKQKKSTPHSVTTAATRPPISVTASCRMVSGLRKMRFSGKMSSVSAIGTSSKRLMWMFRASSFCSATFRVSVGAVASHRSNEISGVPGCWQPGQLKLLLPCRWTHVPRLDCRTGCMEVQQLTHLVEVGVGQRRRRSLLLPGRRRRRLRGRLVHLQAH